MTITTRAGKGSELTIAENDANLIELSDPPPVTISGNTTLTKATHQGKTLFCTAACNLTVDSSTDFDAGQGCNIVADGGIVTVIATATVNRIAGAPLTVPRYAAASLLRTSTTDVYLMFGGMA